MKRKTGKRYRVTTQGFTDIAEKHKRNLADPFFRLIDKIVIMVYEAYIKNGRKYSKDGVLGTALALLHLLILRYNVSKINDLPTDATTDIEKAVEAMLDATFADRTDERQAP